MSFWIRTAPPSSHAPESVPSELDALVLRCLEKAPELRPTTRELGERLAALERD